MTLLNRYNARSKAYFQQSILLNNYPVANFGWYQDLIARGVTDVGGTIEAARRGGKRFINSVKNNEDFMTTDEILSIPDTIKKRIKQRGDTVDRLTKKANVIASENKTKRDIQNRASAVAKERRRADDLESSLDDFTNRTAKKRMAGELPDSATRKAQLRNEVDGLPERAGDRRFKNNFTEQDVSPFPDWSKDKVWGDVERKALADDFRAIKGDFVPDSSGYSRKRPTMGRPKHKTAYQPEDTSPSIERTWSNGR